MPRGRYTLDRPAATTSVVRLSLSRQSRRYPDSTVDAQPIPIKNARFLHEHRDLDNTASVWMIGYSPGPDEPRCSS